MPAIDHPMPNRQAAGDVAAVLRLELRSSRLPERRAAAGA